MNRPLAFALLLTLLPPLGPASTTRGYYRFPAIHGDTVVFTAEGDLWLATLAGGVAWGWAR